MASHRAFTTDTTASTASNGSELGPRVRDEAHTAGERLLKRAALVWLKISADSTSLRLLRLGVYCIARYSHCLQPEERL